MFPRVFSITSVKIRKPLIHFNRLTKPIELRVVIGVSSFVAVYVITTGYYFIRKILCFTIMVVIQCPHCSLEVELDDGVSGLFDCPHCGEEFQWGEIDEEIDHKKPTGSDWAMSRVPRYVGIVFVLGVVLLLFPVILALLLPVLFGVFFVYAMTLGPIAVGRARSQRRRDGWREIKSTIKAIKEHELE